MNQELEPAGHITLPPQAQINGSIRRPTTTCFQKS